VLDLSACGSGGGGARRVADEASRVAVGAAQGIGVFLGGQLLIALWRERPGNSLGGDQREWLLLLLLLVGILLVSMTMSLNLPLQVDEHDTCT